MHERNVRVRRIAGFGTAGTAVVACRAQGAESEFILVFRRRNLKPKRSLLNLPLFFRETISS